MGLDLFELVVFLPLSIMEDMEVDCSL